MESTSATEHEDPSSLTYVKSPLQPSEDYKCKWCANLSIFKNHKKFTFVSKF